MELIKVEPWKISCADMTEESRDYRESIFSQGNGYLGIRGYRPDQAGRNCAQRTTFFAGFFEYIRPGITDMVNQPDFSAVRLILNETEADKCGIDDYRQTLNMKNGELCWSYVLVDAKGRRTRIEILRVVSMAERHLAGIRYTITPENYDGEVQVISGVDCGVENLPIADNQLQGNSEFVKFWTDIHNTPMRDGGVVCAKTKHSLRETAVGWRLSASGAQTQTGLFADGEFYATSMAARLKKGQSWRIDKLAAVACFRDSEQPGDCVRSLLTQSTPDYDVLLQKTQAAWAALWDTADVIMDTSDLLQGAVRYNIFQLMQDAPRGDAHASIGARGLMHGRYKGCYFWDTEIFMLPFFRDTLPDVARNLLMYRYHTLADAKESARRFSVKGARYAWMASDTGFEQCETWDTGCCEIHITADIAYAIGKYIETTGDDQFFCECGAEILIETARYWYDRFSYSKKEDCYHLLFVKGPDEYCGVTTDDFYTVRMAKHNLQLALNAIEQMKADKPDSYNALMQATGLSETECEDWRDLLGKTAEIYDAENDLWIQDRTFSLLEPLEIIKAKDDLTPLYYKLSFDRLQRYRVLKQPDVLMCMVLMPDVFTQRQKEAAWRYYDPITLHDSTLSYGIHALMAARLGYAGPANDYFEKTLLMDLRDVMKNTAKEGLHTAALGVTWQALIYGFCGLSMKSGKPVCKPKLPSSIKSVRFTVFRNGKWYRVNISCESEVTMTETEVAGNFIFQ